MPRLGNRRLLWILGALLLASAALLSLQKVPGLRPSHLLARHWQRGLADVADERVADQLRKIAGLGEAGVPVLVEAIGSDRQSVSQAARLVLRDRIDEWQLQTASSSSGKIALLARQLARYVGQFSPAARREAADLATRILLWPVDGNVVDRGRLVSDCETVLRAAAADRPGKSETPVDMARYLPEETLPTEDGLPSRQVAHGNSPVETLAANLLMELPGGGLPVDAAQVPPLPDSLTESPPAQPKYESGRPRRLDPLPEDYLGSANQPRQLNSAVGRNLRRYRQGPVENSQQPPQTRQLNDLSSDPTRLTELDDAQLMRRLRLDDRQVVQAVENELRHRGFQDYHLQLALRLTDPDPAKRKALAEALPRQPNINAQSWLKQLARDEDPEVRITAIGILATTANPSLVKWLRRLELEESDRRVLRQVRNALRNAKR